MKPFQITNVSGLHLLACCQFPYKTHIVSMSSIFEPTSGKDIQIWPIDDPSNYTSCIDLEEAIRLIDEARPKPAEVEQTVPFVTPHRPATAEEITAGRTLYCHNFNGTSVEFLKITAGRVNPQKANPSDAFFSVAGIEHPISMGDRAVPGYEYDDRPARIYLTQEAAEATLHLTKAWWDGRCR